MSGPPKVPVPAGWRFAQAWPCVTCPFRSDDTFYMAAGKVNAIADHLAGGAGHVCHKTYPDPEEEAAAEAAEDLEWVDPRRQCAGAIATTLADPDRDVPDAAQVAERLGLWNGRERLAAAPVYPGVEAWRAAMLNLGSGRPARPATPPVG